MSTVAEFLIVPWELATQIGDRPAMIVQRVAQLTEFKNSGIKLEGKQWVFNSYEQWQEDHFPFLGLTTIRTILVALSNAGVIETMRTSGSSRRKYYRCLVNPRSPLSPEQAAAVRQQLGYRDLPMKAAVVETRVSEIDTRVSEIDTRVSEIDSRRQESTKQESTKTLAALSGAELKGSARTEGAAKQPAEPTRHRAVADAYCGAYKAATGRDYVFSGGRDGKSIKEFLSSCRDEVGFIERVLDFAFENRGKIFECKRAVTISGFTACYSAIVAAMPESYRASKPTVYSTPAPSAYVQTMTPQRQRWIDAMAESNDQPLSDEEGQALIAELLKTK